MPDRPLTPAAWPELLKPATAAAMLDLSPSTFRAIWPALAAHHGLQVIGLAGPKFHRGNLLAVLEGLASKDLDVVVDKTAGVIRVGGQEFPIRSTRTGKSGRGRPARHFVFEG